MVVSACCSRAIRGHAREESLHDPLSDDLDPAQAGDFGRIEKI